MSNYDLLAGYSLAKQVNELASWLAEAPGFIQIPDHFFEALESMAETAANTIGLTIPAEDSDDNVIDVVNTWLKEWDENHPDE